VEQRSSLPCILRGLEGVVDGFRRPAVVPVGALNHDAVGADITTVEAEVVVGELSIVAEDPVVVSDDLIVVADVPAGLATDIVVEGPDAGPPLLENNGLGLDLADLLGDDLLGHLLEDNEALLDDLDALGVAHYVMLGLDVLLIVGGVEVVLAVEVVESVEGLVSTPRAERMLPTTNQVHGGCCHKGGERNESDGEFGEHFC